MPRKDTPLRTCVGCRKICPASSLARLVLVDGQVVPASPGRRGRGASLHPSASCLAEAVKRGAFSRAFRQRIEAPAEPLLLERIQGMGRQP